MATQILDATGNSYGAKVNEANQLDVFSVSEASDRAINHVEHTVWSLPFEAVDPTGADDYFFHIKNTGTEDLAITDIRLESSVVGTAEVHYVTGTASAGTAVSPVNRWIGNTNAPTATIQTGADITGLTNGGVLFWINLSTADELFHLRTTSNIFIPPGQQVAIMWDTSTGVLKGMVSLVQVPAGR